MDISELFLNPTATTGNFLEIGTKSLFHNQQQTNEVFSEKWEKVDAQEGTEQLERTQKEWYLDLYGFKDERSLGEFLRTRKVILDAGCGLGYKAAWFAKLSPESIVIGMDYSEACKIASEKYRDIPNLYFVQADISDTGLKNKSIDYVSCDQVIMHTENVEKTFNHLSNLLSSDGEFACYVYAKKALPREILDDYFRSATHSISNDELWEMSRQLTELGRRLSELNTKFESPDIPLLGIKGGEYDIQRFIYWNFLKCFWREDWSTDLCDSTNFDWYSPSNARRFAEDEFMKMVAENHLNTLHFHKEEACYSGRFRK